MENTWSSRFAQHWTQEISPTAFWRRTAELDRQVLRGLPGYAAAVDTVVGDFHAEVQDARSEIDARTRRVDPAVADLRSPRRTVGTVLGALGIGGAFAFFFSRADFDMVAVLPWSSAFLAVGTVGVLMALLPVRRSAPATRGLVQRSWLLAGFATAAAAAPLFFITFSELPGAARTSLGVNLVLAGVCCAVSALVTVTWLRLGTAEHSAVERQVDDVSTQREAVAESALTRHRTSLEELHRDLAAEERETLYRAYTAAGENLVARGVVDTVDQVRSHVPGMLMLQAIADATIRSRTVVLVPQLAPPQR
ncbi:hypothetical protein [Promicromonospora sp. NPDC050262]|uniref:hypothetical protein n=1 Tax=Promicromonospora sp. NPDC050262 TaxID=3155036 RepID=UPI0033D9ECF7